MGIFRKNLFIRQKVAASHGAVSLEILEKIREGLSDSYGNRLQSKLATRYPINLELKYSTEGSPKKAHLYDNMTIQSTEIRDELKYLFYKHRGRLLIIGEPGAGKTTLLLQLAIQLLTQLEEQIPIIINIATWRERFSSVEDWLMELLPQMGFSNPLTNILLSENLILPLFDGLDELAAGNREPCLEAIGSYGRDQHTQYIICSRIAEYVQTTDAPVYCQIKVKPLTLTQIKKGLNEANSPETKGILYAIKRDPFLGEVIKTPFYLNTAQLLFSSMKSWDDFGFVSDSLEGRSREVVEMFVQESINNISDHYSYRAKKWLAFIADRLNHNSLVTFELVNFQYDWTSINKLQLFSLKIINGLVTSLTFNLFMIPFFTLIIILLADPFKGLVMGFILSLLFIIIHSLLKGIYFYVHFIGFPFQVHVVGKGLSKIETKDTISFSFFLYKKCFKKQLTRVPFMTLVTILPTLPIFIVVEMYKGYWMDGFPIFVLFLISFCIILNLILCPLLCLVGQFNNNNSYLQITKPYQRFIASMRALHFSILQHFHLKSLLHRKGLLPKSLIKFLKKATKHHILESDGGSWRFRHRILQDYFADHWQKVYAEKED